MVREKRLCKRLYLFKCWLDCRDMCSNLRSEHADAAAIWETSHLLPLWCHNATSQSANQTHQAFTISYSPHGCLGWHLLQLTEAISELCCIFLQGFNLCGQTWDFWGQVVLSSLADTGRTRLKREGSLQWEMTGIWWYEKWMEVLKFYDKEMIWCEM